MDAILQGLERLFAAVPLALLQAWGQAAYFAGLVLAALAFGGFTLRPAGRPGLGRERQAWDATAVLSVPITFLAIVVTGWLGSFVVLVPGAQTLESLKDLAVFLCIVLFGYPALVTVPFAYGLSDLVEGVPPAFLIDWLPGYFINPACFWIAYQLIGKDPDFRKGKTWAAYGAFVLAFLAIEPALWGHICAGQFTAAISYRAITPALVFTTGVTWLIAPFATLAALPAARTLGLFWAAIPGHVRERRLGSDDWTWESGGGEVAPHRGPAANAWPIQIVLLVPFIGLTLAMVAATACVTSTSAEEQAQKLAERLHEEVARGIQLAVEGYVARRPGAAADARGLGAMLAGLPIARDGVAFLVDRELALVASSGDRAAPVVALAIAALRAHGVDRARMFAFDRVQERPLLRETWLARVEPCQGWLLITATPESYYLSGVRAGHSKSALVFSVALLSGIAVAIVLSGIVTRPLRRVAAATEALAHGALSQRVPTSRMEELDVLARAFNAMAERLARSFAELDSEVQQRVQAESALRELAGTLERRVAERTAELETALVRAESADRLKSAFLATMSHELRTPLNSIIGFTGIVLQGLAGPLTDEQSKQLGMVLSSAKHLLALINDVLDLSRIEAGEIHLRDATFDLAQVIEHARAALEPVARTKGLALVAHVDPALGAMTSDRRRVEQILLNLLNNAVKFTERGSVTLTAECTAAPAPRVRLSVTDTGIGIDPADLPTLFQPFRQLDAGLARQHEGTGLGLAICQRLAVLLGGTIEVTSARDAGTTFTVELPLTRS